MRVLPMAVSSRRKKGAKVGKTKRGNGTKWMVLVDGAGTSAGSLRGRGDPSGGHTPFLIADRGYDSHPLRARLARRGLEPIIPARATHKRATHQEGRKLRRYRRRWSVERTFGWLGPFRRLVVRYERLITTYAGFFHLACAILTMMRKVLK
jgi:transposase